MICDVYEAMRYDAKRSSECQSVRVYVNEGMRGYVGMHRVCRDDVSLMHQKTPSSLD